MGAIMVKLKYLNLEYMNIPTFSPPELNSHLELTQHDSLLSDEQGPNSVQEAHLQQFRTQVQIGKEQLVQLATSGDFEQQTFQFNNKAMQLANEGYLQQSGILLAEAEKILEYAANSGKTINRQLIITILHNSAFCHQQTWRLQQCSGYLQALIFNLNCQIKQIDNDNDQGLIVADNIQLRNQQAHYYLLFCAINSQLRNNDRALIAAKKAHHLFRVNSGDLSQLAVRSKTQVEVKVLILLEELSHLDCSAENVTVQRLLELVRCFFCIWKNKCKFPTHDLKSLLQKLNSFSIGNVMQMEQMSCNGLNSQNINFSMQTMLERVLMISISYFTMATELRLLALKMAGGKQKALETSEFRQSECYHLTAIILVLYYLPFETLYLEHILISFKTHYSIDIALLDPYIDSRLSPQQLFQDTLTTIQKDDIKSSTAGNSEKGCSSRNSCQEGRHSYLNKLQSYVRASLKSQKHSHNKQMQKLNNYYYIRGQLAESKEKMVKASKKLSYKHVTKKKSCLTSKNSAQKTPIGFTSHEISPKKSKCSSRSSKALSKRENIEHTLDGRSKKMNVMEQYFRVEKTEVAPVRAKLRSHSKSKSGLSKQNKEFLTFAKPKPHRSPANESWKATNLTNRHLASKSKSKNHRQLKSIKSSSKRQRLNQAKSKKKVIYYS